MMLTVTLIAFLLSSFQYWEDSDVVKALRSHVQEITLNQNEGRAPGTEGEKAVADYVCKMFKEKGLDVLFGQGGDLFKVATENGDTLNSRNVVGYLEGYDGILSHRYMVIGARMDNMGVGNVIVDGQVRQQIYAGANGNASGLAMMLELAGMLAENSALLKRSVIFVAFGSSTASFAGAWHFVKQSFGQDVDKIDAMINLDMLGVGRNGLQAFTSGNEDLNLLVSKVSQSQPPIKAELVMSEPYPSDHQVFYASEIPSVFFTGGRYSEHNTPRDVQSILDYDFMERTLEYLFTFSVNMANLPPGHPSFRVIVTTDSSSGNVIPWSECDVPPMFLNNPDPTIFLKKWVYVYLKYPEDCIQDGIQGRVMVEFTITKTGELKDIRVVRGVDEKLDEEALKVIQASPKWKPAKVKGQKVDCSMTIPVEFRLKKRK